MSDFLTAPRGELIKLIYELIEENKALRSQIAELKARMGNGKKEEKPLLPSFVKLNVKKNKTSKKRKSRAHGFARKKDAPTEYRFHSFDACPDCNGILGKPSVAYTRQVIDVPMPSIDIIEHVICKRWCLNCQKRFYPQVSFADLAVGRQRIGTNLMALINTLREQFVQPLNKIQQFLSVMYNLSLSEGELVKLLHRTATIGKPTYEHIKTEIRSSDVVYADETGGREDGQNGYFWNFSNKKHQLLLYRKSRSKQVVKEALGTDEKDGFQGVLVSDFYASYNEYQGFHQRCFVHLDRDIDKLLFDNPKDRKLKQWAKAVLAIYHEAKDYGGPDPTLPMVIQAKKRIEKEAYFKNKMRKVCEPYITEDVVMTTLSCRVINFLSELFTFVRFPNVDSDNNRAERAVRHTVVKRKIFGGTRSARGSETTSILGSLFGTWRLQNLNPLEQCKLLLINSS